MVIAFADGARDDALACARALRQRDLVVTVEASGRPWDEVARRALEGGAGRAVLVRRAAAVVREAGGSEREIPLSGLLELGRAAREPR